MVAASRWSSRLRRWLASSGLGRATVSAYRTGFEYRVGWFTWIEGRRRRRFFRNPLLWPQHRPGIGALFRLPLRCMILPRVSLCQGVHRGIPGSAASLPLRSVRPSCNLLASYPVRLPRPFSCGGIGEAVRWEAVILVATPSVLFRRGRSVTGCKGTGGREGVCAAKRTGCLDTAWSVLLPRPPLRASFLAPSSRGWQPGFPDLGAVAVYSAVVFHSARPTPRKTLKDQNASGVVTGCSWPGDGRGPDPWCGAGMWVGNGAIGSGW